MKDKHTHFQKDRRNFLKTMARGGAVAAGTLIGISSAASAQHQYAADSTWRQFYPTEFIEKLSDYKIGKRVTTICPFCGVGCSIIVTEIGGKIIETEGDPFSPINEGRLCSKGSSYAQLINSPDRLKRPLRRTNPKKGIDEDPRWEPISWSEAYALIARKVKEAQDRVSYKDSRGNYFRTGIDSRIAWTGSLYFHNEELYLAKKMLSLLGTMNTEFQGRRCQASSSNALGKTFGIGAVETNHIADVQHSSVILLMGNTAECHPLSMRWMVKAKEDNDARIIYIDPRYGRTLAVADTHAHVRPGTNAAFILGIIRYLMYEHSERVDWTFLESRTNAPYDTDGASVSNWKTNSRSIYVEFKTLVKPYTPEEVSRICGIPADLFSEIAEAYTAAKPGTMFFSNGVTQQSNATQSIRAMAILQLLLGNMGVPGGGIRPYKSANGLGASSMGMLSTNIMAGRSAPRSLDDVRRYQKWKNSEPSERGGLILGTPYRAKDKAEEQWDARHFPTWNSLEYNWGIHIGTAIGLLPELEPVVCDLPIGNGHQSVQLFRAVEGGAIDVVFIMGENSVVSNPNATQVQRALSQESVFTVCCDLFETETAHFADILLPAVSGAEKSGSLSNSARWVQWRNQAIEPMGDCKSDFRIISELFARFRMAGVRTPSEKYNEDHLLTDVDADIDGCWPSPYGTTVEDVYHEFAASKRDDAVRPGKATVQPAANIIYQGSYNYEARPDLGGILPKSRDRTPASSYDEYYGLSKNWAWAWFGNQRTLYDTHEVPAGMNVFPTWWATTDDVYLGMDKAALWSPLLHSPGSVADLISGKKFGGTASKHPLYHGYPLHNEPVESPDSELAAAYPTTWDERFPVVKGSADEYPCVLTNFRVIEQTGTLTRSITWLNELMPDVFAELSVVHAARLGVSTGDMITIATARGEVSVKALVTRRIAPLTINGTAVDVVAMPWNWGFKGRNTGPSANDLTIDALDISGIPESKTCLCNVRKGGI